MENSEIQRIFTRYVQVNELLGTLGDYMSRLDGERLELQETLMQNPELSRMVDRSVVVPYQPAVINPPCRTANGTALVEPVINPDSGLVTGVGVNLTGPVPLFSLGIKNV